MSWLIAYYSGPRGLGFLSKVQSVDQRMRLASPTAGVPSHTSGAAMKRYAQRFALSSHGLIGWNC